MKIYIAGPMTGIPDWNRQEFYNAETLLTGWGHTVFNPCKHQPNLNADSVPHEAYMKISLAMIDCCEAVWMLPGWKKSKGACIEADYAIRNHKAVFDLMGGDVE